MRRVAALVLGLLFGAVSHAQPLGTAQAISGNGCRFPDIAWSAVSDRFLAVWADYSLSPPRICGRLLGVNAEPLSEIGCYSDVSATALYPAVAWNGARDEFLVSWDDSGRAGGTDSIWGQRVTASNGGAVGPNFPIATTINGIRSGVASVGDAGFAVTYYAPANQRLETFLTFVTTAGDVGAELNVSEDTMFSGYPAVTALGDRVLVTWDRDDAAIGARIVSATTQTPLGPPFTITPPAGRDRPSAAADQQTGVFWVNFNDQSVLGQSYNQQAQRLHVDGALLGAAIDVAATDGFEGETLVGTDIAFDTWAGRAICAFQLSSTSDNGLAVQEINEAGALEGTTGLISTGADGVMAVSIDERRHHAFVVWEKQNNGAPHEIYVRAVKLRDSRAPAPPALSLADGGSAVVIRAGETLDVQSVSLFRQDNAGTRALLSTSDAGVAVLGFEVLSGTQTLCATASDGTNDSTPTCIDITAEPVPSADAGVVVDGGTTTVDGGNTEPFVDDLPGAAGSCGCGAASAPCLLVTAALFRWRRRDSIRYLKAGR